MPNTHRLTRKRYWHFIKHPKTAPKREPCWTTEFARPFRNGIGIARKFPLSKKRALVIGRWVSKEEQAKEIMKYELSNCQVNLDLADKELRNIIGEETLIEQLEWS